MKMYDVIKVRFTSSLWNHRPTFASFSPILRRYNLYR